MIDPSDFVLRTSRIQMRPAITADAPAILDYWRRNRDFHRPWFPRYPESFYTLEEQERMIVSDLQAFRSGNSVVLWIARRNAPRRLIGRFNFAQITYGAFRNTILGYHLDREAQGCGLAREAGEASIACMFRDYELHRIEANIMPHNLRSIRLAESLGFTLEGRSRRYMQIDGRWRDHLRFVRLSEDLAVDKTADDERAVLIGDEWILRHPRAEDAARMADFVRRNRDRLSRFQPLPHTWLDENAWRQRFARLDADRICQRGEWWGIYLKSQPERIIGYLAADLKPEPFASAELSFAIDRLLEGRGWMLLALQSGIEYLHEHYGIRRFSALVHPDNQRSLNLLRINGFAEEGTEKQIGPGDSDSSEWVRLARLFI